MWVCQAADKIMSAAWTSKGEAFLEEVKKVYTAISTAILQTHSRTVSKARLHYSKSGAAESFSLHLY